LLKLAWKLLGADDFISKLDKYQTVLGVRVQHFWGTTATTGNSKSDCPRSAILILDESAPLDDPVS